MIKYNENELIKAMNPAYKWAKQNLNPHQEVVITLEGVIIKDYYASIPSKFIEGEE